MKTKEELNALKEEVDTVSRKLRELTEDELAQVSAGTKIVVGKEENEDNIFLNFINWLFKIKS